MSPDDLRNAPSTDPTSIYRCRDALYATDLLIVALVELDFFSWLDRHPSDLAGICSHFGLQKRPADVMLTLFRAQGLLEENGGIFSLTVLGREHLTANSPWFIGPYYASLKDRPVARDLARVLRTGQPANWGSQMQQKDWHKAMESEAFAAEFTAAMDCRGVLLAQALARTLDLTGHERLLDVAGGSGIYACSLSAFHPHLIASVLEKAPVDQIAAGAIARRGCTERVSTMAGDMLADSFPGGFDLHLLSNVLHDWDEEVVRLLIAKSFSALPSGGLLVIHDAFLNSDKSGPLHVAEYSVLLMHSTQGRCYSIGEMESYLREAGFGECDFQTTAAARGRMTARKP
jgi:hypothetical protein